MIKHFSKLNIPVITRSSGCLSLGEMTNCPCQICKIATENAVSLGSRSAGKGFAKPKQLGRPPSQTLPTLPLAKPVTICSRCRQVIGKGIRHPNPCTVTDRRSNLHEELLKDPRGRELEASQLVTEKLGEAAGTSTFVPLLQKVAYHLK